MTRRHLRALLPAATTFTALIGLALPASAAGDDYPYRCETNLQNGSCPGSQYPDGDVDPWEFNYRECVSFVAWRLHQHGQSGFQNQMTRNGSTQTWGDAHRWDEVAPLLGYTVSSTPVVGSIAQWNANEQTSYQVVTHNGNATTTQTFTMKAGTTGHVAYVTGINSNGTVRVEQYNANVKHGFSTETVKANRFLYIGVTKASTSANPAVRLSQSSSKGVVTLTLKSYASSSGKTAYFFRRSGQTGKVYPYGTATIRSDGSATRVFSATPGQILAIYAKDTGVAAPTSGYSNTVSFKVG